ncbi:Ig-like domain-containing protein [Paenibacillus tarimensis]|uniref:Ig-like domain-containing protein n=2 Tax=Paenibacillus tarimensis TaxID=416012 RepID=UPI0039F12F6E
MFWKGKKFILSLMAIVMIQLGTAPLGQVLPQASAGSDGPLLLATYPANKAVHISPGSNLTLTFDEDVTKGSGAAAITLRNVATNEIVESYTVATSSRVSISPTNPKVVTIDPEKNMLVNASYYVLVDEGAFVSNSGKSYAGIRNATDWSFTVAASDTTAPVVTEQYPVSGAVSYAGAYVELTFNKPVVASNGTVTFASAGDTQTVGVLSSNVQGGGTNKIRITPLTAFKSNTSYSVSITAGAFQDTAGNSFAAYSGWTFTTSAPPMPMPVLKPEDNAYAVSTSPQFSMTFNANIVKGTSGSIKINKLANNETVRTIPLSSVTVTGNTASFSAALEGNTAYYILVDAGVLVYEAARDVAFQGIYDASTWNFSTGLSSDTRAPQLVREGLKPQPNGTVAILAGELELLFDEPVFPGSGSITIRNAANHTTFTSIPVTSNQVTGGGTTKINVKTGLQFVNGSQYYVQVSSSAFVDASGNYYVGIHDTNGWKFTASSDSTVPTIVSLSPVAGTNSVRLDSQFTATFSKPISIANPAGVVIKRASTAMNGSQTSIATTLSISPEDNRKLVITPAQGDAGLAAATSYYVEIAADSITDMSGNRFGGILNPYEWTFQTIGSDRTAPALTGAQMSGGSKIALIYNEELAKSAYPYPGSYYVTVNGVSRAVTAVSVEGQTVFVTLQSGVVFGQTVKISYTVPEDSKAVQDLSENKAIAFNNYEVTNTSDNVLPRPTSGTIVGNTLTLTFNESLNTISPYAGSQFSVMIGGSARYVQQISGSNSTLTLTLSSAAGNGESVTVSYTPGSYPLKDLSGNSVQAFSGFSVVNNLDTRAPVITGAAVNGSTVTLTYDEALSTARVPAASQFTVVVNGTSRTITNVRVEGRTVLLTLASEVTAGQSVLVSYTGGTPAVSDASGNAALPFSGMNAGVVTTGTYSGLYASGSQILITYPQALDAAYTPLSSQFTVKVGGSLRSVASVMVSGTSVYLTLHSPVLAGEVVTVSYYNSGIGLRTSSGTTIPGFMDNAALNQTAGTGTAVTLPDGVTQATDGAIQMDKAGAMVTSDTTPTGMTVNRYTITNEKLSSAFSAARNSSASKGRVVFAVPETERAAVVAVPLRALEEVKSMTADAAFIVKYKDTTYEVPVSAIDYAETAKLLNAGGTVGYLLLKMEPTTSTQTAELTSAINRSQAQLMTSPVIYQTFLHNNGPNIELPAFKDYVTRTIRTAQAITPRQSGMVWLDPQTGILSYAPTKMTQTDGYTLITFKSKISSSFAAVKGTTTYKDVEKHWGRNDVLLMVNKFVAEGKTASAFEPDKAITRGEFAAYISKGLGLAGDKAAAAKFKDVNTATTMAAYIGAASKAGIIQGYTDGTFKPNAPITREQIAAMLVRAANTAGKDLTLSGTTLSVLSRFKDRTSISPWAQVDIAKAVSSELINGTSSTVFSPKSNATRAQAAVMIKRLLDYVDFMDV